MKKRLLLTDPKLVIYDPATGQREPPEGILADPRSTFWRRRIRIASILFRCRRPSSQNRVLPKR